MKTKRSNNDILTEDEAIDYCIQYRKSIRYKVNRYIINPIRNIVSFPRKAYYDIKFFIQRGKRGWADCDTWSVHTYVDDVLIGLIKGLKEKGRGHPACFGTDEKATKKWHDVLDSIIEGIDAHKRYAADEWAEFIPCSKEEADKWSEALTGEYNKLVLNEEKKEQLLMKWRRGAFLLFRWYDALWW